MVRLSDFIRLEMSKEDVELALSKAIQNDNVGIDNLRQRFKMVRLDCKIRGYLGEISLRNWFSKFGITFNKIDFFDDDLNMDIDMVYNKNGNSYNFEVKTSLVPDSYKDMSGIIQKADIKIIKRTNSIETVSGDIHIQIYFDFLRKVRDSELKSLNQNETDINNIYRNMKLDDYINNTYFVAWIDKPTLINYINSQYKKTWTFPYAQKDFWKCPLCYIAKRPIDIINYINNLR